jgi:nicotinamidase-related amidase
MTDDTALADLLAFVLAGRPERATDLALSQMGPHERSAVASVTETIAALAQAEPGAGGVGTAALRERIVSTIRERRSRRPRRAVLVCDMINDHLTPGRPLEVPRARDIVPAVVRRLDRARAEGVPVVYVLDRHEPGDPELDEWTTHAVEGSEGAEVWPPLAPRAGDHVVTKTSYSSFTSPRLQGLLDELRVDTLVLTGCATEVQLLSTAMDALQRGFAVELPADTQAGQSEPGEQFALGIVSALVPYAPARKSRLESVHAGAA